MHLFRELATRPESREELNRLLSQWIGRDFPSLQPEEFDIEAVCAKLTEQAGIPAVGAQEITSGSLFPLPAVRIAPSASAFPPDDRRPCHERGGCLYFGRDGSFPASPSSSSASGPGSQRVSHYCTGRHQSHPHPR